jgi:hypothetical protein
MAALLVARRGAASRARGGGGPCTRTTARAPTYRAASHRTAVPRGAILYLKYRPPPLLFSL